MTLPFVSSLPFASHQGDVITQSCPIVRLARNLKRRKRFEERAERKRDETEDGRARVRPSARLLAGGSGESNGPAKEPSGGQTGSPVTRELTACGGRRRRRTRPLKSYKRPSSVDRTTLVLRSLISLNCGAGLLVRVLETGDAIEIQSVRQSPSLRSFDLISLSDSGFTPLRLDSGIFFVRSPSDGGRHLNLDPAEAQGANGTPLAYGVANEGAPRRLKAVTFARTEGRGNGSGTVAWETENNLKKEKRAL
ncbi:hypothetical protein AAFF_G00393980 [Aldrovandia affinis]|uniref:Uncharacterized protein n=1 Tax=Aldrovandia affinis TaxID=143900 RepID=A0AAD7SDN1_9TELE|nr:hypothetical protein AAFF_G00393980 [Aldrovandia affinis]